MSRSPSAWELSGTTDKEAAKKVLRRKDHLTDQGVLVTPEVGKLKFSEGLKLLTDYHEAFGRDTKKMKRRIAKHLTPFFGPNRMMATITSDAITAYREHRRKDKPTPTIATVNHTAPEKTRSRASRSHGPGPHLRWRHRLQSSR